MKNLKNALLLKQLYTLKQLGYRYTSVIPYIENEPNLTLPNSLENLKKQAIICHLCDLSKHRKKVVFGEGNPKAKLMIVGDMPNDTDDNTGKIFTGRSGELLTKMLENVLNIRRDDVYITNLLKCRALNLKKPSPAHTHTCHPYLVKEIELVNPSIILTMGELSYQYLCNDNTPLEQARGSVQNKENYILIPTYHPNYLLRNPSAKKEIYDDLVKVKELL